MTDRRGALGARGEALAAAYLSQRGYRILARNLRTKRGEIDLVALDRRTLVFVEVRTRSGIGFGTPEASVDGRKRRRLARAARAALAAHRWPASSSVRFDVVAVERRAGVWQLRLVRDAFQVDELGR